jgi:predicted Zn-dependent peptidase
MIHLIQFRPRRKSRRVTGLIVGLAAGFMFLACALAQQVPVQEHTLPNGLRVLLLERHDDPSIAGGWVAHVGSANERPGITGLAHFFEHMMFKGTPAIGTKNYTPRYRELEQEFQKLIEAQREIIVKNEFDRIYRTAGGAGMNAFTMQDMTAYFITVPANKLELWMWMESERILRPVFREFYAERDVVFEERRMRTESTPTGKFDEALNALFWESHPYHWPVIGWPSDVPAYTKAQADEFYATYYAPQNLTLILVGDFNSTNLLNLVSNYFGRIPRGPRDAPELVTLEIPAVAEKRMNAEAEVNPQVEILWKTVGFGHRDAPALQILGQILSTRTGRLHKRLVLDQKVATDTQAIQYSLKYGGVFIAAGEAAEDRTPAEVEQAIYDEITRLQQEPVPERELQKVKNNFAAAEYRKLTSNMAILQQLIRNAGMGDWRAINEAGPKLQAVTAADIQRVAKQYFTKENRTVCTYTRKPATATATAN